MKHLKFFLIFILADLFFSSCSDLQIKTTNARFYSPEVVEDHHTKVDFSSDYSESYKITDDASARPPNINITNYSSNSLAGTLGFTVIPNLEIGAGLNTNFNWALYSQYQFVGEAYKVGNQASIRLDVEAGETSKSGDQNGVFGSGGYPWKAKISAFVVGLSTSYGYRINENVMPFLGGAHYDNRINSKIEQSATSDGTNAGGTYTNNFSAYSDALGLGCDLNKNGVHLTPILQWTKVKSPSHSIEGVLAVFNLTFTQ